MKKLISLIAPMYNEEEMAPIFYETIVKIMNQLKDRYNTELILVNDGSKDRTWEILKNLYEKDNRIHAISFSRNFGQEAAVAAGLALSKGDACILMDADLQDPPELILEMLKKYEEGYEVVNAKRVDRKKDTFLKRYTAKKYYDVIHTLSGKIRVPKNVNNFRLISRKVVDQINALPERNRVFRVLVPFVGYKTTEIEFVRRKRPKGETKYNFSNMFKLAGDSITSSSLKPLTWPLKCGIFLSSVSFLGLITFIVFYILECLKVEPFLYLPNAFFLLIFLLLFCFGILFIFTGIIAQYVGKAYIEAQDRPLYIIDEELKNK